MSQLQTRREGVIEKPGRAASGSRRRRRRGPRSSCTVVVVAVVPWVALSVRGNHRLELEREVENAQLLHSLEVFFDPLLSG